MPAFIKTPEDERLWAKAKERAKEEGKAENWAYITGVYKKMKGGKVAEADPEEELAIRALLYEDTKENEKVGASYPGNLGAVEMVRFYRESTPQQQSMMDKLLDSNKLREAWELLKRVTGVKLKDPNWKQAAIEAKLPPGWKKAPASGSYIVYESLSGLVRVQDTKRAGHPMRYQVLYQPVSQSIVQDGKRVERVSPKGQWIEVDDKSSLAAALALGVTTEAHMKQTGGKTAAALGPYIESVISDLRVIQVDTDARSKAQIQGNKLLIKWGPDAPLGSVTRTKYLPKWVAWAKKHLDKKTERVEVKKDWARTNVGGYSVYDLEGKDQVAAILAKIRQDVQPILKQFGLVFTTLSESVAEGSLGFNRGARSISLNVRQKDKPMLLRKYSAIMATMLHELAHLRHMNHGPQFKLFEAELVAWARTHGIYAPGPVGSLFFTAADLTSTREGSFLENARQKQSEKVWAMHPRVGGYANLNERFGDVWAEIKSVSPPSDPGSGSMLVYQEGRPHGFEYVFFADVRAVSPVVPDKARIVYTSKGGFGTRKGPQLSQMKTAKSNAKIASTLERLTQRYAAENFSVPHSKATVQVDPPQKKRKEHPYQGFIDFQGLQVHVENLRGSVRKGVNAEGVSWEVPMKHHYGEVSSTEGVDHDPVDVYIGFNADSPLVVVVRQQDPKTKEYDEDKVMLGFDSEDEAVKAYKAQYDAPGFYQSHKAMPIGRFLRWCLDKDKKGQKVSSRQGGVW